MRKWLALGVIAVLVLGGIGWGSQRWTHPHLLDQTSPLGDFYVDPTPVAKASFSATIAIGPHSNETITLHKLHARFKVNTARATTSFSICHRRPGQAVIGAGATSSLHTYCSEVVPIHDGTRFHFSSGDEKSSQYILLTITPSATGTAYVDQVSFTYSRSAKHWGQHGTETSSQQWVVRARA